MALARAALLSSTPMIRAGFSLAEALQFDAGPMGYSVTREAGDVAGIRRCSVPGPRDTPEFDSYFEKKQLARMNGFNGI